MKIEVYKNRNVYREGNAGTNKENKAETIEFKFPNELDNYTKYIEFDTVGGKFVDDIEGNIYTLSRNITKYNNVKAQVVLKDLEKDIIFKSNTFTLSFNSSINASEELEEESKGLLDTIQLELLKVKREYENLESRVTTLENKEIVSELILTTTEITEIEVANILDIYLDRSRLIKDDEYTIKDNKIVFDFIVPAGTKILIEKEAI